MYGITDLKTNVKIDLDGEPYQVIDYQHSKMGRGGAVMRTKLRNLKTGALLSKTFQGNDKLKPAPLKQRQGQFLYADQGSYVFMDTQSYEQFSLSDSVVGGQAKYLKDGLAVELLDYSGEVIAVELPSKLTFRVKETDPGVKGDTVTGGSKPAVLETGHKVTVPLFVQIGDEIKVDTRTGAYVERA